MKGYNVSDNLFNDIESFLYRKKPQLFTDKESETIITAFVTKRGEKGFTEDEVNDIFNWCLQARIDEAILNLLLKGMVLVDWNGKEPIWSISPLGKEAISA